MLVADPAVELQEQTENLDQFSFFLIKPDAVASKHSGTIIRLLEFHDFEIKHLKLIIPELTTIHEHYQEHKGKPFFKDLVQSLVGKRLIAGSVVHAHEPANTVRRLRDLCGPYDPLTPGTIRGDFGKNSRENGFHASATFSDAMRELILWFPEDP